MRKFLLTVILLIFLCPITAQAYPSFHNPIYQYDPSIPRPSSQKEEEKEWYEELENFVEDYPAVTVGIITVNSLAVLGIVFIIKSIWQVSKGNNSKYSKNTKKYIKLYKHHYKRMVKLLEKQELLSKEHIKIETAAFCYTTINVGLLYANKKHEEILSALGEVITKDLEKELSGKPVDYINQRGKFYAIAPSLKHIHAIAVLGNPPEDIDRRIPMKLALVMLDCLLCPDCIRDYANGELVVFDIFKLANLLKTTLKPLADEFVLLNSKTIDL